MAQYFYNPDHQHNKSKFHLVLRQHQHVTASTVSAMRAPAIDMAMMIMVVKPMSSVNKSMSSHVTICDLCGLKLADNVVHLRKIVMNKFIYRITIIYVS